jgi:hypothetical protein
MPAIETDTIISVARELFSEAYEGAQGANTWFVNNEPNCGILGSVSTLNAEQASRTLANGGRSVAAHIEHLRWSLANVNTVARGGEWNPDWSTSWSVQTVTDQEWKQLQTNLRHEYELVLEAMSELDLDGVDRAILTGILSLAPHAAHHLGTIRQMVRFLLM